MHHKHLGELLLFCVVLLAAIGWFFSKYAIEGFPAVGFIGVRFFLAGVIFLPFAYSALRKLSRPQLLTAMLIGTVFAGYLGVWIMAISNNTDFGSGSFIVSLAMLFAPLLAWLMFRDRLSILFAIAMPFALCGLYLLTVKDETLQLRSEDWLYLLTALLEALYFVLNGHYAKHIPVLPLTTLQLLTCGILCGGYSLLTEDWSYSIPTESYGWLAASVLIATSLRFLLQTIGQKLCSISNAALIMLLEPVWTLIFSAILFSEPLGLQKLSGCGLILLALVIYRFPRFRR